MSKKKYDEFSVRMKEYEKVNTTFFPKRLPIMVRVDGKAFHTYTKGMKKPFDEDLSYAMWETAKFLCSTITGCKIAYTQSDEITLLIINYAPGKYGTETYYKNNKTKIETIAASKATVRFNQIMSKKYPEKDWAEFDARAWVMPKEEVVNNFIWRQQDATKNSISMVAQANFHQNQLQNLDGNQLQEKLWQEKNINWNKLPVWQKRGVAIIKKPYLGSGMNPNGGEVKTLRHKWDVDFETPIFTQEREYIEKYVYPERYISETDTKCSICNSNIEGGTEELKTHYTVCLG